ncbi:MAG: NAD-dependent epimerase/dehydratase family protein, partial [Nitrospirota bacterium]
MKVLITGGLGFIGGALANRLCREHQVTVLTRSEKGRSRLREPDRVRVKVGIVEEITAADCAGMDLVVHCASTVD